MAYNVAGIICMVNLIFSLQGYESAPPSNKNSIIEMIKKDGKICSTPYSLLELEYFKICNNYTFPTEKLLWNVTNKDLFLCVALYDRALDICHEGSLTFAQPNLFPSNASVFNSEMAKMPNVQKPKEAMRICVEWKNSTHNNTMQYVNQLSEAEKCLDSCFDKKSESLNPLCYAISIIDSQIEKMKMTKKNVQTVTDSDRIENMKIVDAIDANEPLVQNPAAAITGPGLKEPLEKEKSSSKVTQNEALAGSLQIQPEIKKSDDHEPAKSPLNPGQVVSQVKGIKNETLKKTENKSTPKESIPVEVDEGSKVREKSMTTLEKPGTDSKNPIIETKETTVSENTQDNVQQNYDENPVPNGADINMAGQNELDKDDAADPDPLDEDPVMEHESFGSNESTPRLQKVPVEDDSHFFGYFSVILVFLIGGCVAYHHKQKILAIVLEGRRSRSGRGKRRPSTANYRKLDSNLEEAVNSQCSSNATHVIY